MFEVGLVVFAWSLWAVLFWGSIRLLEPQNGNNSFGKALAIGALYVVSSLAMQQMALIGLFFAIAWLVFLLRLLIGWYELGILKSIGVVAAVNVTPYFLVPWLYRLAGSSIIVLCVGFPATVLGVWLVAGKRIKLPAIPRAKARIAKADKPVVEVASQPIVRPPIEPPPAPPPPGDKPRLLT